MCGICGIALTDRSSRRLDARTVEVMRDTMVHRGPDDAGVYLADGIGLGHRRLSIIDVHGGHQPMPVEDESLWVVYNGEVYNHGELRAGLEARGHRYRTRCDTETVLRLYQEMGAAAVRELRGMFAFAIWDHRKRELFLARDRLGIKPLYYVHAADGSLYFASEIKALLAAGATRPALNLGTLPDYLANHATSGTETLFEGVRRLAPGHTLRWHDGEISIDRYWDVRFTSGAADGRPDDELVDEFRERFQEAVRTRLMSDVPLGVFLSGGIDSAAITAMMAQLVQDPIKTFSVAFREREANEFEYARLVANAFGTDHHEVVVSPDDFFGALPDLIWHEDEPIAHPSSIPLHFVSKLAAEHVKVVLTGEGSDELMAGYARYWKTLRNLALGERYEQLAPEWVRRTVQHAIAGMPAGLRARQKLIRTFLYRETGIESLYLDNFAVFAKSQHQSILSHVARDRIGARDPYASHHAYLASANADNLLDRLLYTDVKTYLHELLMKQDQMSMSASIESRVPFLDHPFVEFVAGLPERMKLRGTETKYILRESMRDVLPSQILKRGKMGFPVPFGRWVRGRFRPLVDDLVLGGRAAERDLFETSYLREIVDEHMSGRVDHSERIWSLINLELWQRRFVDGEDLADNPLAALQAVG